MWNRAYDKGDIMSAEVDGLIDDEQLIFALAKVQRELPEADLVLMRDSGVARAQLTWNTPRDIGDWLKDDGFPLNEEQGAVPKLCSVGMQLRSSGRCDEWAVLAKRGDNSWEVFFAYLADPGSTTIISKGLAWGPPFFLDKAARIEARLPELRQRALVNDDERVNGITMIKSDHRNRLSTALRQLATAYDEAGRPEQVAEVWEELGPLLTEALPMTSEGVEFKFVPKQ